jgi:hypothetical protein
MNFNSVLPFISSSPYKHIIAIIVLLIDGTVSWFFPLVCGSLFVCYQTYECIEDSCHLQSVNQKRTFLLTELIGLGCRVSYWKDLQCEFSYRKHMSNWNLKWNWTCHWSTYAITFKPVFPNIPEVPSATSFKPVRHYMNIPTPSIFVLAS